MATVIQYQVSEAYPSTVGGTSGSLQYFFSNPPQSLWNTGQAGVNAPVQASQLGQVPSATSSIGMLPFDASGFKLQGGRFRLYASGVASVTTGTPTVTPIIQIVTPNVATGSIYVSPVYTTFLMGTASSAMVANLPVSFWATADLILEPSSGTLSGVQTWQIVPKTGGGATVVNGTAAAPFSNIVAVQGLVVGTPANPNVGGQVTNEYLSNPGFGFVAGVTFSAGSTGNSASLTEFKVVQD
jgi:hypothetical protein